ncbi:MAG: tyrosine-protein phosphatase [Methylocystis sp.]
MIDLHSHILPGIDDGAPDLGVALEMARIAVANGVAVQACTPHILPGLFDNSGPQIRRATEKLQRHLDEQSVPLRLVAGADVHVVPNLVSGLRAGEILSLADTRYVLVEPPHHVAPPRLEQFFFELLASGYVPVLTHPERLAWIETRYETLVQLFRAGVWMQVTAGSLTGAFGRRAKYWAERMLSEALVHILASDAHGARRRPPDLAEGRAAAAKRLGEEEADQLVSLRPRAILANAAPSAVRAPAGASHKSPEFGEVGLDANIRSVDPWPHWLGARLGGKPNAKAGRKKEPGLTAWLGRFF